MKFPTVKVSVDYVFKPLPWKRPDKRPMLEPLVDHDSGDEQPGQRPPPSELLDKTPLVMWYCIPKYSFCGAAMRGVACSCKNLPPPIVDHDPGDC